MSEDDPAFYWERMFKNLIWENSRLLEQLVKLEDLNRWRKWPEESPTETGCHMVRLPGKCFTMTGYWNCFGDWDLKYERFYWMPQIPLPKEGE